MQPLRLTPLVRVGSRELPDLPISPRLDAAQFKELWEDVREANDHAMQATTQSKDNEDCPELCAAREDGAEVETCDRDFNFSPTSLKVVFQTAQKDDETTRSGIETLDHSIPHKIVSETRDRCHDYIRSGQHEAARKVVDDALVQLEEEFKDDCHVDTAPWKACIAELLIDLGRQEEARHVLAEINDQIRDEHVARIKKWQQNRGAGTSEDESSRQEIACSIETSLDRFRRCEAWDGAFEAARMLHQIDPAYFDLRRPVSRLTTGSEKVRRFLLLGLLHEYEGNRTTDPRQRQKLFTRSLEIYNRGCYARELYEVFLDSHGEKVLVFDHSDAANIFFSAARVCTYFDKEGLLDGSGNRISPREFQCRGSPLTGRTWKHQALHYLEQGRSRALLTSISKRAAMTDRQRKFIQDTVLNDMSRVAKLAVWSMKKRATSAASLEPSGVLSALQSNGQQEGAPEGATSVSPKPAQLRSESSEDSIQSLRIQTSGLTDPTLSPLSNSPASDIASPQPEEVRLSRMKIYIKWRKALLYAITKDPTLGAVLPSAGNFGEIEEMISSIPSDTIVVEYALASTAPCGVMAIVTTAEGVKAAEWKEMNAVEIQKCIVELRDSMSSSRTKMRGSTKAIPVPTTRRPPGPERKPSAIFQEKLNNILRDAVVTPVQPYLQDKAKLIVIPSGDLSHVPWTIFFDLPITVVPSLNIWNRLQTQVNSSICQKPKISVVSNAPKDKERVKRNQPALRDIPYSRIEALYIARQHQQWPFIADDGDRKEFEALADGKQILHLCAHGTFNADDPHSSSIQLFDEPLTLADWSKLSIRAELVVFSSCLSGASKAFDSGSTIGFAHTLLGTGTKAFIGSLWPVDDAATLLLMYMFYEELQKPLPATEALYEAQKRMKNLTRDELDDIALELEGVAMDYQDDKYVINSSYYIAQLKKLDVKEMAEEKYWAAFVLTGYGSRAIYPEARETQ